MNSSITSIPIQTENTKHIWFEFTTEGKESKRINPEILESWKRCKEFGVNHDTARGKKLPEEEFTEILKRKKQLIQVSRPIMKDLYNIVKDSSYAIVLTDEKGVILETIWNENGIQRRAELNFVKGSQWTEQNVGTNAIGTSLYLDKPIQTLGAEHYCSLQHRWTCSAAPIHNNEGDCIGIIDLSGDFIDYHPHTLGMIVAAANAIQNQLQIIEHRKWIDVAFDSIEDGILILNSKYQVNDFNNKLCEILGISNETFKDIVIKELLKDVLKDHDIFSLESCIEHSEVSLYINKKRFDCSITISPVIENGNCLGAIIAVKKLDVVRSVVNKVVGNSANYDFDGIITKSENMMELIKTAKKMAKSDFPILIEGESGTGKELFAHSIHSSSSRCNGPFIAINCAALPKDLVESELFGYAKGAFTGALIEGKPGKFELANGGTILLDEIGELPLEVQAKLLRVLDNFAITRIGGSYERKLDVRVIAATNRILSDEVDKLNFRGDLFYRLNVLCLSLPPLRKRVKDIYLCAEYFLQRLNEKNTGINKYFDQLFIDTIEKYEWKGNIRELQNVVQRAYYISEDKKIGVELLPDTIIGKDESVYYESNHNYVIKPKIKTMIEVEKALLIEALYECNGNVVMASKIINIGKSTFYRKMKEYGIEFFPNRENGARFPF